jgi:hypothetical protein
MGGAVRGGAVGTVAVAPAFGPPYGTVVGGVVGGVVAGVVGDVAVGVVAPEPDGARLAKNTDSAATHPTPTPVSQRVVVEMRRIPVSRSTDRCGATACPLVSSSRAALDVTTLRRRG